MLSRNRRHHSLQRVHLPIRRHRRLRVGGSVGLVAAIAGIAAVAGVIGAGVVVGLLLRRKRLSTYHDPYESRRIWRRRTEGLGEYEAVGI